MLATPELCSQFQYFFIRSFVLFIVQHLHRETLQYRFD
jgi:hypothetical protein